VGRGIYTIGEGGIYYKAKILEKLNYYLKGGEIADPIPNQ
jgi:hypothetical protein